MTNQGFYGWKLLAALWFIMFVNLGFPAYGATIINTAMGAELGLNRQMVGLPFTVFFLVSGLPAPLVAMCINRKGARFALILGSVLVVAGALAMALFVDTAIGAAVAFGGIVGLGVVTGASLPSQTVVALWFQRRRARAMAILLAAVGMAGFVAPSLLNAVIANFGGWRAGWWVFVALSTLAALIAFLFVKERPADVGQFPDGIAETVAPENAPGRPKVGAYVTSEQWTFREGVLSPTYWLLLLCMIGVSLGYSLFIAHGVPHLIDLGHTQATASLAVSTLAVASLFGHFIVGALGDRVEPRFLWSGAIALFGVGLLLFLGARSPISLFVFATCLGVGWGVSLTCLMAMLANYFGTRAYASLVGITLAVQPTVSALAPWVAGSLYDDYGSYALSVYPLAALCFLGSLLLLWARPPARAEPARALEA